MFARFKTGEQRLLGGIMEKNTFSKMCVKLFFRLIFLDIACFILCAFGIAASDGNFVRILLQIACIIVTIAFVYPVCHKQGDVDATLIPSGHRKNSNLKGLLAGIIACSPYLISSVILVVSRIFGVFSGFMNYYKMINSFFFPFLYSLMPTDYSLTELSASNFLLSLSVQIFIPIICLFSYILGKQRFLFKEVCQCFNA